MYWLSFSSLFLAHAMRNTLVSWSQFRMIHPSNRATKYVDCAYPPLWQVLSAVWRVYSKLGCCSWLWFVVVAGLGSENKKRNYSWFSIFRLFVFLLGVWFVWRVVGLCLLLLLFLGVFVSSIFRECRKTSFFVVYVVSNKYNNRHWPLTNKTKWENCNNNNSLPNEHENVMDYTLSEKNATKLKSNESLSLSNSPNKLHFPAPFPLSFFGISKVQV